MKNGFTMWVIIALSFLAAMILMMLPLPTWAIWLRPAWIALIVIYWALAIPYRFGIGVAWLIGLFFDLLQGTLLGEHALVLAFLAYTVIKLQKRLSVLSVLHRTLAVFCLILLYQLVIFLIQGILGKAPTNWQYWLTPFTSALFWPWVYNILKSCQRRYKIIDPSITRLMFGRE